MMGDGVVGSKMSQIRLKVPWRGKERERGNVGGYVSRVGRRGLMKICYIPYLITSQ
jgi:hypothetical protein